MGLSYATANPSQGSVRKIRKDIDEMLCKMSNYLVFLNEVRQEFPAFQVVSKNDSFLMRAIGLILFVLTFGAQRSFMTNYVTTIGQKVYVPSWWEHWESNRKLSILRHERVHMRQARKYSFPVFALLYIFFPLPFGLAYFRARFEWEGYEETMRADAEYNGSRLLRSASYRRFIVEQFTTGAYGWMWPFPRTVESWYDTAAQKILSSSFPDGLCVRLRYNTTGGIVMNNSGLLVSEGPAIPHLSKGEVADLRSDVVKALKPLVALTVDEFTNPVAPDTVGLKAATATVTSAVTLTAADLLAGGKTALAAYPRNVTFTTDGNTPTDAPASAVVTGTDIDGNVLTETINLAQAAATTSEGSKAFKTLTSIVFAVGDGTDATVAVGFGKKFGLSRALKSRAGRAAVLREVAAGTAVTTGVFSDAASSAPYGTYAPSADPDGSKDYAVYYEFTT